MKKEPEIKVSYDIPSKIMNDLIARGGFKDRYPNGVVFIDPPPYKTTKTGLIANPKDIYQWILDNQSQSIHLKHRYWKDYEFLAYKNDESNDVFIKCYGVGMYSPWCNKDREDRELFFSGCYIPKNPE